MSKCGRNVLKTPRYDSVLSPHFSFTAKFMRTESVKCPARAVFAKSRARHVHIMSLNLLTSHKSPLTDINNSISRVSYVHSPNHYTTCISFLNTFTRSADLEFQLILYSRIETARHLVRSDFFLIFAKIYTNFEIQSKKRRKLTKFKKNTHKFSLSLSLSLSLLVDSPMECLL